MSKIVVLGGGISGLSAAFYLARSLVAKAASYEITLIDKGDLGGWVQSVDTGKGIFELGPRSLRTAGFVGANAIKLADELGLADFMINVKRDTLTAKHRYIYANNQLNPLPSSLMECFKTMAPLPKSIASIYLKAIFKQANADAESVYDVISSRFGEDVTRWYVDPFVRGVFAADCKQLSFKAAFPTIWQAVKNRKLSMPRKPRLDEKLLHFQEHASCAIIDKVRNEGWSQWNLEGGLAQFISALERGCQQHEVKILKNTEADRLFVHEDGTISVTCQTFDQEEHCERTITADHVISTIPAACLGQLVADNDPKSTKQEYLNEISQKLTKMDTVNVGMVNLQYEGPPNYVLPELGFGHLVPSCVESKVLGIVYDSCVFPEHDSKEDLPSTRITCMMGGSWFNDLFGDPEHVRGHDFEQAALESVSEQLGIRDEPMNVIANLHRNCIPTYRVGHTDVVENMEDTLREHSINLHLGGMSYWGVSVNDCIYNSRYIADHISNKILSE